MASPQKENGFTGIANEIMSAVQMHKFSLNEYKIILCVWRFTYGFNRKKHKMSRSFFINCTGLDSKNVNATLKKLIEKKVINKAEKGNATQTSVYSFNKNYEAWKVGKYKLFLDGDSPLSGNLPPSGNSPPRLSGDSPSNLSGDSPPQERKVKDNTKENIYTLFDLWNEQKIIKHRKIDELMKRHTKARLNEYDFEELRKAIKNYSVIVGSPDYYWTHKWTFGDFMKPSNVVRFLDQSEPFDNFRDSKAKQNKQQPKQQPDPRDNEILFQQWMIENPDRDPEEFYKQQKIGRN